MPSKTKREQVSDLTPVTAGPAKARRGFVPLPGSLTCSLRPFAPSPSGLTLLVILGRNHSKAVTARVTAALTARFWWTVTHRGTRIRLKRS